MSLENNMQEMHLRTGQDIKVCMQSKWALDSLIVIAL